MFAAKSLRPVPLDSARQACGPGWFGEEVRGIAKGSMLQPVVGQLRPENAGFQDSMVVIPTRRGVQWEGVVSRRFE